MKRRGSLNVGQPGRRRSYPGSKFGLQPPESGPKSLSLVTHIVVKLQLSGNLDSCGILPLVSPRSSGGQAESTEETGIASSNRRPTNVVDGLALDPHFEAALKFGTAERWARLANRTKSLYG